MDSACALEKHTCQKPKVIKQELLVDEFIKLRRDTISFDGKASYPYFVVTSVAASISILALSHDGKLLLTREYRHPVERTVWGCPGGAIDAGEEPLEAAARELLEETGCSADSLEVIGKTFPLPGLSPHVTNVVLARGTKKTAPHSRSEEEWLEAEFVPFAEVEKIVLRAEDVDGILCQALYFFELHKRRVAEQISNSSQG